MEANMSEQTLIPEKPQTVADVRTLLGKAYSEGASDDVVADLEARLLTLKQTEAKVQAEKAKAEVAAKQAERQVIVDEVAPWVKFCKKLGCPTVTVNAEAILTAQAVMELVKLMPNVVDRVAAAKGTGLQFMPYRKGDSDKGEWDTIAQAVVTVPGTKTAKPTRTGNGVNRGGKLIAIFDQFATDAEKAALTNAITEHKAKGGVRPDGVEYAHRVAVKKRCLEAGLITPE